jgi:hypothetical protein
MSNLVEPKDFGTSKPLDLDDMFGPEPELKVQEPWSELMRRQFLGQGGDQMNAMDMPQVYVLPSGAEAEVLDWEHDEDHVLVRYLRTGEERVVLVDALQHRQQA